MLISLAQGQPSCLPASFCMSSPYYDALENLYAIDVRLLDFDYEVASGIVLEVEYSNLDFIIDATKTIESIFPGLQYILGTYEMEFDNAPGRIDVNGVRFPFNDGPILTTDDDQILFTIYYSSSVAECADFTFRSTDISWVYDPGVANQKCELSVGSGCEPSDVCFEGYTLSGNIESPVLDCLGALNGGLPNVDVNISESNGIDGFGCSTLTDSYGDFDCDVVEELDYRVTPKNESDRLCGITELDFVIIRNFILTLTCFDHIWQLLAADINQNGMISSLDLVALQNAVLANPISWPSWTFVPVDQYNGMYPDLCENDVPAYDRYIDVADVTADVSDLDFVGIKMGDVNATCTECDVPLTGEEEILFRSSTEFINAERTDQHHISLSFDNRIEGLEVLLFSIPCSTEQHIQYHAFQSSETLLTKYTEGIFYVSYVSLLPIGESYNPNEPFLILKGNFEVISQGDTQFPNTYVSKEKHASLEIREVHLYEDFVFPNPTRDQLVVKCGNTNLGQINRFYLFDSIGKQVFTTTCIGNETRLDLTQLPGLYFYKIDSQTKESSGKLIIY